jgi:hypothetical protein
MNPLTTIRVFGIYSLLMGAVLLFIPGSLHFFGLRVGDSAVWARLLGFVLCCSSYYYLRSAAAANFSFARYTVHTRMMAPLVVAMLIITGEADLHFMPFGIVDGVGGLWTYMALKAHSRSMVPQ